MFWGAALIYEVQRNDIGEARKKEKRHKELVVFTACKGRFVNRLKLSTYTSIFKAHFEAHIEEKRREIFTINGFSCENGIAEEIDESSRFEESIV
ncbi:hypothetical protein AALP_AAs47884U000100 [Arabis alpina]|uniref:Uncharacterized protein n=1 Tax=Arabis alpina TaxID=50452 RepID=A0A087G277_ARAAL|nr:hypothetical protein AALP_AAs47884U000100 [Arabis alpina]